VPELRVNPTAVPENVYVCRRDWRGIEDRFHQCYKSFVLRYDLFMKKTEASTDRKREAFYLRVSLNGGRQTVENQHDQLATPVVCASQPTTHPFA
jgi:hypothetical protein